jgi:hypothetical protein
VGFPSSIVAGDYHRAWALSMPFAPIAPLPFCPVVGSLPP